MANITIEVAYATPHNATLLTLQVPQESTLEQAIVQSGILDQHPHLKLHELTVGIWSKKTGLNHPLKHQDRIEIYRPLKQSPQQARQKRVLQSKEDGSL